MRWEEKSGVWTLNIQIPFKKKENLQIFYLNVQHFDLLLQKKNWDSDYQNPITTPNAKLI